MMLISLSVVSLTSTPLVAATPLAERVFILKDKKLGPVTIGKPVGNLPKAVDGLYDNFKYEKIEHDDDMDGPWTEEYYLFTLKGKEIFRVNIDEGVVYNICALIGSGNIIKTPDGYHVGYSAREFFKKKPLQWYTYFTNEVYADVSDYTYVVSSDDIIGNVDVPKKLEHFKTTAKIQSIIYK